MIKDYSYLREKWAKEEAAKKAFGRTIDKLNEQAKEDSKKYEMKKKEHETKDRKKLVEK